MKNVFKIIFLGMLLITFVFTGCNTNVETPDADQETVTFESARYIYTEGTVFGN